MRKGWDKLSPGYRRRLERNGITRRHYELGGSLVRARGHFPTPVKRPGIYRRERRRSELWAQYRHRARKLGAYESIRREFLLAHTIGDQGSALRQTIEFYESLEAQYADDGEGGAEYEAEWMNWYGEMVDEWSEAGEWRYPELDLYYHGTTKG